MAKTKFRVPVPGMLLFFVGTLLAVPVWSATYYVSSSVGNDSNSGTSKSTPWLHAPGMVGCSGNCARCTPAPGDSIILKGGDTWLSNTLPLTVPSSGSSANQITYGVDTTWYSGTNSGTVNTNGTQVVWASGSAFQMNGSWTGGSITINGSNYTVSTVQSPYQLTLTASAGTQTGVSYSNSLFVRPIFNGQFLVTGLFIFNGQSYVTVDSIELTGVIMTTSETGASVGGGSANGNEVMSNLYVHNWTYCTGSGTPTSACTAAVTDNSGSMGGVLIGQYSGLSPTNIILENSNVGDPENGGNIGACTRGVQTLISNYIHDCTQACLHGCSLVHDNVAQNIGQTFDGTTHGNGFYMDCFDGTCADTTANFTAYLYNNWLINITGNATATAIYPNPGTSGISSTGTVAYYIFNNVESNPTNGGQIGDEIDPYGASAGQTTNVYDWNNTYDLQQNLPCVNVVSRAVPMSLVDVRNLHCISAGGGTDVSFDSTTTQNKVDTLVQSPTTANSQGYVAPTWGPADGATAGAGTDLTSFCSGTLTALCTSTTLGGTVAGMTRPASGAWDIGAYFVGGDAPDPPSNVSASAH